MQICIFQSALFKLPHSTPKMIRNASTQGPGLLHIVSFLDFVPLQMPEVQHQTEEQRAKLLAEHPVSSLYLLKRKCNGCQEQDLSLLEGELVALLEDTDPSGSSSRWLVHTGGQHVCVCLCVLYLLHTE